MATSGALLIAWANLAFLYLQRDQDGDRERAADLLYKALADAERLCIPEAVQIRSILEHYQLQRL